MVVPACLRLADGVFPRVRAEAARRLVAAGWSQTRAAGSLGVSQAMVSKYVSRGDGDASDDPLVARLTDDLVQELLEPTSADGPSSWCHVLTVVPERPGAREALDDLMRAERSLLDAPPLRVVPQIGMNLVRAVPDAASPADVLGYPARFVRAGDRLLRPAPPAFGASEHLAACLLALRAVDPDQHALASVLGGPDVRAAAAALGTVRDMQDGGPDRLPAFQAALTGPAAPAADPAGAAARFVHDPGAVGIEPCLYIAGETAQDVAATLHRIHERTPK